MEASHKRLRLRKQHSDLVVQGLRVFWVTVVLWGEIGVFYWSLSDCAWPDKSLARASSGLETAAQHVLLIADPYIPPPSTKPLAKLTSWLSPSAWPSLHRESHLHKSWSVTRRLRPDLIIFLGDMLGTGRSMQNDIEFDAYVKKFRDTFRLLPASSRSPALASSHSISTGLSSPSQSSTSTFSSKLCLLPATSSTVQSLYLPIFFLSFAVLLVMHFNMRRTRGHKARHALSNSAGESDWVLREKLEFLPKFTDGIRFPLNSSRAPGHGGEDSEKSGADTPSRFMQPSTYFEMPLPAWVKAGRNEDYWKA